METRANHIWVGAVTLALLAALALFIVWIVQFGNSSQKEYDIFFKQSVSGLAKGSGVSYSGVPAGQVEEIALWQKDPQFVRVRIVVDESIPVLQGTTATIQNVSFTAPPVIQLEGAIQGAPEIVELGPEGVPVIPTKPGALGELLNSAPVLIERLATLTEQLTKVLNDDNQETISGMLKNTERLTGNLANQAPEISRTMQQLQLTLKNADQTLAEFSKLSGSAQNLLDNEGRPLAADLRKTLDAAQKSAAELSQTLAETRPVMQQVRTTTLPEAEALMRELQEMSNSLTAITERLDQEGAGSLLASPKLPDYEP
ncbi:MlaD family protein [Sphingorhabdus sp. Alg239-R122]|uniref:MlaD family protein n=1 Tax=Sphingorhabdus sp. Alg239-R122 TaxID=2305989 RepID=UPI0013DB3430|nr:MlaD family protein [Sphingorhabdus sp. Alg239-R122]